MGAFKGYFDESGKDGQSHNALALCGFVASADTWTAFERAWDKTLKGNEAPFLHMKELQDPHGPLARFAGKENETARTKLLSDLAKVIQESALVLRRISYPPSRFEGIQRRKRTKSSGTALSDVPQYAGIISPI